MSVNTPLVVCWGTFLAFILNSLESLLKEQDDNQTNIILTANCYMDTQTCLFYVLTNASFQEGCVPAQHHDDKFNIHDSKYFIKPTGKSQQLCKTEK